MWERDTTMRIIISREKHEEEEEKKNSHCHVHKIMCSKSRRNPSPPHTFIIMNIIIKQT